MFNIIPSYSYVHWNTTLTHWEITLKPNYWTIHGKKMTHDTKMAKQNLWIVPIQCEFHFQNSTKKYLSSLFKSIKQRLPITIWRLLVTRHNLPFRGSKVIVKPSSWWMKTMQPFSQWITMHAWERKGKRLCLVNEDELEAWQPLDSSLCVPPCLCHQALMVTIITRARVVQIFQNVNTVL
jgi:hypothetical protein